MKFFLFTQLSSLLMLVAILALYFAHHHATGIYTFEYTELLGTPLSPHAAMWIMLGFFIAFAVKLPMFPFHTWLARRLRRRLPLQRTCSSPVFWQLQPHIR